MPKTDKALHSDLGTSWRHQHDDSVMDRVPSGKEDTTNRDRVRMIDRADPLNILIRHHTISRRQRDTGLFLRALWEKSGIEPCVCSQYKELIGAGSVASLRATTIDHYQKYTNAMLKLTPNQRLNVEAAVCFQERIRGRRVTYLKQGLDKLMRIFGI